MHIICSCNSSLNANRCQLYLYFHYRFLRKSFFFLSISRTADYINLGPQGIRPLRPWNLRLWNCKNLNLHIHMILHNKIVAFLFLVLEKTYLLIYPPPLLCPLLASTRKEVTSFVYIWISSTQGQSLPRFFFSFRLSSFQEEYLNVKK